MSAYNEGMAAYWHCKAMSDNPHSSGTKDGGEWLSGWLDAQEEDQESEYEDDGFDDDFDDEDWDDDDEGAIYY